MAKSRLCAVCDTRPERCPTCDLAYADQPPSEDEVAHAYHVADYDRLKSGIAGICSAIGLDKPKLGLNAGNLFVAGFKHG